MREGCGGLPFLKKEKKTKLLEVLVVCVFFFSHFVAIKNNLKWPLSSVSVLPRLAPLPQMS